jgi:hypothetical protein
MRAMSERERPRLRLRRLAAIILCAAAIGAARECVAQNECLVEVKRPTGEITDGSSVCAVAQNKTCTFQLQLCLDQADGGCSPAALKKKVKAKGKCRGASKLQVTPDASNPVCGSLVDVMVKTKKKGTRDGKCKISVATKSKDKPARRDVDKLTLVCTPNPSSCPAPPAPLGCLQSCDCCVLPVGELARCIAP